MEHLRPEHLLHIFLMTLVSFVLFALLPAYWSDLTAIASRLFGRYVEKLRLTPSDLDVDSDETTDDDPALQPVAMPYNANNDALSIDHDDLLINAIVALINESRRRPFSGGIVPETRAIETVFGISRSSAPGSRYQSLRAKLKTGIGVTRSVYPPCTPEQEETRQWLQEDK